MTHGQKHLVRCRCILPQFRSMTTPPQHQFTVFSEVDDDDKVVPKLAQCPNCGCIHKVTDLTFSIIVQGKETASALVTLADVKGSVPQHLQSVLEANSVDLATWEAVQYAYQNKRWGEDFIVLTSEEQDGTRQGKYIRLLGDLLYEVKPFSRDEVTSG